MCVHLKSMAHTWGSPSPWKNGEPSEMALVIPACVLVEEAHGMWVSLAPPLVAGQIPLDPALLRAGVHPGLSAPWQQ